jgi:alkanesulfonate monooxygenase SsuD/methylene tetrahydromethanopterin reductase-like flavin-dependent oxidoreductase (luciferase family)
MDRLGEGLAILTALLHTETPQQVEGRFFRLQEAVLAGPRLLGRPPILIGGSGPKRTIPLAARYCDIWNAQLVTPEEFQQRSTLLDELLAKAGRQPSDVKRTMTLPLFCGRDDAELDQRAALVRRMNASWASVPIRTIFESLRPHYKSLITGTPEAVVEQIRAYGAAGVAELIVQWANLEDMDGLRLLAEHVLPHVGTHENVGR